MYIIKNILKPIEKSTRRENRALIVGIDLGTTNSLIGCYKDGEVIVIPNRLGEKLTPSVVSVDDDGVVYVGNSAKERKQSQPQETVDVFKRSMGTAKEFELGNRRFSAEELSSLVLRYLKEDAEAYLGEVVEEAVISVPAYFNDSQRKATKRAGELAGFRVERIVSEPTAAAIAYGIDKRNEETKFLVFDLGGGTFDVSILELYANVMEVRAVAGDNYLGGEDFTQVIEEMFFDKYYIEPNFLSEKTRVHIRRQAEATKLLLSENRQATMKCQINQEELEMTINVSEYEDACQHLLEKIKKPIERSLKDANIRVSDIDEVVLVGGATKLPIVRKFVSRLFGRLPNVEINPDEVVVVGAATQAAMKERNQYVREVVLTDVCPFTLGIETSEMKPDGSRETGIFSPLIERNSVIPISRKGIYSTVHNNQEKINIEVYQGESRRVKNNLKLGSLTVNIPMSPAGHESVEVVFTYDINSLLEVEVTVLSTKKKKRMVIKNEEIDMTDEEIDARFAALASLKLHPREQEENKHLLFRAERLYEETTGEIRDAIAKQISMFEYILDSYDKDKIEEAKERLKGLLDNIEYRLF
ncbi:MAG: Hsp70 family protein [Lachnospiraceae bacterium]|nr:Hsp70 family protein [Lachnospiraceae bacterium]